LLKHNIFVNNLANITPIPRAIWHNAQETLIFYTSQRQANSLKSEIIDAVDEIPVQTISVDSILKNFGCPNLISLTVNGAEVEAVHGMEVTLSQCQQMRLSIAGWYTRDGKRICDIITPSLKECDFQVAVGKLGGVFAWKE